MDVDPTSPRWPGKISLSVVETPSLPAETLNKSLDFIDTDNLSDITITSSETGSDITVIDINDNNATLLDDSANGVHVHDTLEQQAEQSRRLTPPTARPAKQSKTSRKKRKRGPRTLDKQRKRFIEGLRGAALDAA